MSQHIISVWDPIETAILLADCQNHTAELGTLVVVK